MIITGLVQVLTKLIQGLLPGFFLFFGGRGLPAALVGHGRPIEKEPILGLNASILPVPGIKLHHGRATGNEPTFRRDLGEQNPVVPDSGYNS